MRTPGILNPSAFSSEKELRDELKKQGEERGWTPIEYDDDDVVSHGDVAVSDISSDPRVDAGKKAVDNILRSADNISDGL